nr:deaminase [Nocardia elegans]
MTRTAPQGGAESGVVTAHAELTALTAAGPSADLAGATVYAGGEPCPMCSAALVWAGDAEIAVSGPHLEEEALVPFRRYAETVGAATSFTSRPIPPSDDPR